MIVDMNSNENKVAVLIGLIKKSWIGDEEAITKLSMIVGLPPPRIIPHSADLQNREIAHEYLKLTSHMLDNELKQDKHLQRHTKQLRPRTAHPTVNRKNPTQHNKVTSPPHAPNNSRLLTMEKTVVVEDDQSHFRHGSENLPMSNLNDIVPMFKSQSSMTQSSTEKNDKTEHKVKKDSDDIFSLSGLLASKSKPRPVSAALQRRQDYLRTKPRNRPSTAKTPFVSVSDTEYQDIVIKSAEITPRVNDDGEAPPILVSISGNRSFQQPTTYNRVPDKDEFTLGDVSDALHHVQEMERMFRENTRRLQQKIGVSPKGFI